MSRLGDGGAASSEPAEPAGAADAAEADAAVEPLKGFRERYIRPHRSVHLVYRTLVGVVGAAVIVLGVLLLPLPGPGWVVIFLGLGVLASEFEWARRLLRYSRQQVARWTDWVTRQSLAVRLVIGAGFVLLLAALVLAYDAVVGLPSWVPWLGR
jgi:uncharacterized protein (TIGR02611 family)